MCKSQTQNLLTRHPSVLQSFCVAWLCATIGKEERLDNLAMVEVHYGECIVWDEANKVRPHCLFLDPWPRSRPGILLLSLHLSSPLCPPSKLWQGGFQEQLWSVSACHSALVTPGERGVLSGPGMDRRSAGSWMEWPMAVEQWALCGTSRRLGVSWGTLVCATCLTPDTVMTQCALPLQLYLPTLAPQLY